MLQSSIATDGWSDGSRLAIVSYGFWSGGQPAPEPTVIVVPAGSVFPSGGGSSGTRFDYTWTPPEVARPKAKKKARTWANRKKGVSSLGTAPVIPVVPEDRVSFEEIEYDVPEINAVMDEEEKKKILMDRMVGRMKKHLQRKWPAYVLNYFLWLAKKGE